MSKSPGGKKESPFQTGGRGQRGEKARDKNMSLKC
jgi:ribosomal protein L15